MIKEIFSTPLYGVEFEVRIYEHEKEVPKNEKEYAVKNRIGGVYRNSKNEIICVLNKYHSLTFGDIAHECKHLVNEIIIDFGGKLDLNNDETECYLLQWVVDEIYEKYEKWER